MFGEEEQDVCLLGDDEGGKGMNLSRSGVHHVCMLCEKDLLKF